MVAVHSYDILLYGEALDDWEPSGRVVLDHEIYHVMAKRKDDAGLERVFSGHAYVQDDASVPTDLSPWPMRLKELDFEEPAAYAVSVGTLASGLSPSLTSSRRTKKLLARILNESITGLDYSLATAKVSTAAVQALIDHETKLNLFFASNARVNSRGRLVHISVLGASLVAPVSESFAATHQGALRRYLAEHYLRKSRAAGKLARCFQEIIGHIHQIQKAPATVKVDSYRQLLEVIADLRASLPLLDQPETLPDHNL